MVSWTCPQCGLVVEFPNEGARDLAAECGGCQSCRLRDTLGRTKVLAAILEALPRIGFPEGHAWLQAVPEELRVAFGLQEVELSDAEIRELFGL